MREADHSNRAAKAIGQCAQVYWWLAHLF